MVGDTRVARAGAWQRRGRPDYGQTAVDPAWPYGPLGSYKPSASTTGVPAGTSLTTYAGPATLTAGQTYDRLIFPFDVVIPSGVTVRRSRFLGVPNPTADNRSVGIGVSATATVSGVLLEDVEVLPQTPNQWVTGVYGHGYTARRVKITNTVDGFAVNGPGVTIEGCYVDSLAYFTPCSYQSTNETHNDVVQFFPGAAGWMIRASTLNGYYGAAGSNAGVSNRTGPTPAGHATPEISCFMFGSTLTGANTPGDGDIVDNWLGGGYQPLNAGGAASVNLGRVLRNKFAGDSVGGPGTSSAVHTVDVDATVTVDAGEGTVDQNVFEGTSIPVTVRRNA